MRYKKVILLTFQICFILWLLVFVHRSHFRRATTYLSHVQSSSPPPNYLFGFKLLSEILKQDKQKNFFFSPISVSTALALGLQATLILSYYLKKEYV